MRSTRILAAGKEIRHRPTQLGALFSTSTPHSKLQLTLSDKSFTRQLYSPNFIHYRKLTTFEQSRLPNYIMAGGNYELLALENPLLDISAEG
jgi:hypothetical protein